MVHIHLQEWDEFLRYRWFLGTSCPHSPYPLLPISWPLRKRSRGRAPLEERSTHAGPKGPVPVLQDATTPTSLRIVNVWWVCLQLKGSTLDDSWKRRWTEVTPISQGSIYLVIHWSCMVKRSLHLVLQKAIPVRHGDYLPMFPFWQLSIFISTPYPWNFAMIRPFHLPLSSIKWSIEW